jgi:AraC family transcriptional regulator
MELIAPETLPVYVPGKVLADSGGLGWDGFSLRTYAYHGQDVEIPPIRDYMLVSYQQGVTPMQRTFGDKWTRTTCGPGAVSLLTRSQTSHWFWTQDVEVTHIYLTERFVFDVVSEVSGRSAASVDLADVLRTEDKVMTAAINMIATEASQGGMGSELYVEAVARQLVIHLLRTYADIGFRSPVERGQLSDAQKRKVMDYIEARLHESLSLRDIAAEVNMAACTFSRYFRRTTLCLRARPSPGTRKPPAARQPGADQADRGPMRLLRSGPPDAPVFPPLPDDTDGLSAVVPGFLIKPGSSAERALQTLVGQEHGIGEAVEEGQKVGGFLGRDDKATDQRIGER